MSSPSTSTAAPVPSGKAVRGVRAWLRPTPGWSMAGLCAVGGVLLVGSALIHLHLWSTGYRNIPTIGPLFLLQVIAGLVAAIAVVVFRSAGVSATGAAFAGGTVVGLLVSVEVGLFGFKDSLSAPYATLSLVVELAALVVLGGATIVGARAVLAGDPVRSAR